LAINIKSTQQDSLLQSQRAAFPLAQAAGFVEVLPGFLWITWNSVAHPVNTSTTETAVRTAHLAGFFE
jgi:hypothetical protein